MERKIPARKLSPWSFRYHTSNDTNEIPPPHPHLSGRLPDGWSRSGAERNIGRVEPSAELRGGIRGHQPNLWKLRRLPDISSMYGRGRIGSQSFLPDKSPGHLGIAAKGRQTLSMFREVALVKERYAKGCTTRCSGFVEGQYDPSGRRDGQRGSGGGEWCFDRAIIQGYCNWLLDENGTRVRWSSFLAAQGMKCIDFEI